MITGVTKEEHYARNEAQDDGAPDSIVDLKGQYTTDEEFAQNWERELFSDAHNLYGAEGNVSYRGLGDNKGKQYVFNEEGGLVDSAENGGTYDKVSPLDGDVSGHVMKDVFPWIIWGNSPEDLEAHGLDGVLERAAAAATVAGKTVLHDNAAPGIKDIITTLNNLSQTAGEIRDEVAEKATELSESTAETFTGLGDTVAGKAEALGDSINDLGTRINDQLDGRWRGRCCFSALSNLKH